MGTASQAKKAENSFGKFLLLWSGQLVAAIGNGLTSFGLGVYVYQQTGMASQMALVTLLAFLPGLLLSPVAGVLADRYDRRLLMVVGDGLSAIGLVFILLCMLQGQVQLWQICVGVFISSVFSALLEPAYKATVTDLLTEEEYSKASGLVQSAGSARYLLSPLLAGFLLTISSVELLLVIDICTLLLTICTTLVVRRQLTAQKQASESNVFNRELKEGWKAIARKRGVLVLTVMSTLITFALGFIQTLVAPLILAFADSAALGISESVAAVGMLVSSVFIGIFAIKKSYVKILCASLFCAGLFMIGFGARENIFVIAVTGFMFFATLPFANTCLDYLIRTNITNDLQGRACGIIGFISQLGYVAAYVLCGVLADYVFTPLLLEGGALAGSLGKWLGVGPGRGIGLLIILAGILLCIVASVLYRTKSVKGLEKNVAAI